MKLANNKVLYISLGLVFIFSIITQVIVSKPADAVTGSDWSAGRIIDDEVFYNKDSVTVDQIQAFLNAKVPVCDRNRASSNSSYQPPWTCLKEYQENTSTKENNIGKFNADGTPMNVPGGKNASRIIWEVGQNYGINPQVLIVMLQKEQSLITDNWPWKIQYDRAMGYACPDTAPCDTQYYGLYNQISSAAWQLKRYTQYPDSYNFKAGATRYIQYSPDASCGGRSVFIENEATAALYNYTPYQPNAGALANLYGTSTCGAYGNRNFWRTFNDWFGPTTGYRIISDIIDPTSDTSGEQAKVGFRLSKKPSANVYLDFYVQSPSNAEIVGSSLIKITGSTWNKSELNTITVKGKDNPYLEGTLQYSLKPSHRAITNDPRYAAISTEYIADGGVPLLQQKSYGDNKVFRLYSSTKQEHLFTANPIERDRLIGDGWRDEGSPFNYCPAGESTVINTLRGEDDRLAIYKSSQYETFVNSGFEKKGFAFSVSNHGQVPIYWRHDSSLDRNLYTTSLTEGLSDGFEDKGLAFYACDPVVKPVYRLYKTGGSHFYTSSEQERDKALYQLDYRYEKLAFYTCSDGDEEVYRFIKESNGVRFYTTSTTEKEKAENVLKYRLEGVGFKSCKDDQNEPVYRLYNPSSGFRLYTTSESERNYAEANYGYVYEGIGFWSN